MALDTFDGLKTAIQAWLDRTDISGSVEDFITLAEGHFNLKLRCRQMRTKATLTPTDGVCVLPTDYLEQIRVVALTSPVRVLNYISPEAADELHDRAIVAPSNSFTVIGNDLYTFPLSAQDIELTYLQRIPALSGSNTSNWLLTILPSLYLEAAMMEANRFVQNNEQLAINSARVGEMINDLNDQANTSEFMSAGRTNRGLTP